jgi:hypothetical protein
MIRPTVAEVISLNACEEIILRYPTPLSSAEVAEFEEAMALVFRKLKRRAEAADGNQAATEVSVTTVGAKR